MTEDSKALALISQAERALEQASELNEVLDIRDRAKAAAVFSQAHNLNGPAQRESSQRSQDRENRHIRAAWLPAVVRRHGILSAGGG